MCFIDIETTDLDRDNLQVWEVALIAQIGGSWDEQVWQLPVNLTHANPASLAMNGFHERRAKIIDQTDPIAFAIQFARRTRGLHLVGAGVAFDERALWSLLRSNGECPMWHYHLIDVEALAVGFLASQHAHVATADPVPVPPWKHTDLVRAVGVNPDDFDRHTALGDARMAKAVYKAVMG